MTFFDQARAAKTASSALATLNRAAKDAALHAMADALADAERAVLEANQRDVDRARDAYERDDALQQRTGAVYAQLAARHWRGPWSVVGADVDPLQLARVW